jgi:hypothetical protein
MTTAEHRKPLVAFLLVFAAACLIMGNGMRSRVVEVLIDAGAPRALITAVSPDMVLGESLSSAPTSQAVRDVPATVRGPVQSDKDDAKASGSPSLIQSAIESAVESPDSVFVPSRARAAAQKAADRRAGAAQERARAHRGPARAAPAAKTAPAKGPSKAAPTTDHGGKPGPAPRRLTSLQDQNRDQAVTRQTRGPERRASGRGASRDQHSNRGREHAVRRDRGRYSAPDRSSHSRRQESGPQAHRGSQRGPGGGGHHDRGGRGGHGPSGHHH